MYPQFVTLVLMTAAAVCIFLYAVISHNRAGHSRFIRQFKDSWGKRNLTPYTEEYLTSIRQFSDSCPEGQESVFHPGQICTSSPVDDLTVKDLSLDDFFAEMARTWSSPGEDVLYAWLCRPLTDHAELTSRSNLIRAFYEKEDFRLRVSECLEKVGKNRKNSYFALSRNLRTASSCGRRRFIVLALLTLFSFVLLFFYPLPALALLLPAFAINVALHLHMRAQTSGIASGVRGIRRMMRGARELAEISDPSLDEIRPSLLKATRSLAGISRLSFFLAGSDALGTGIGDTLLMYLNLFFHFDLIIYDAVLTRLKDKEEDIRLLVHAVGSVDAALAAASFRTSLPYFAEPCFSGERAARLHTEELYHPQLTNPVANSLTADTGILITGANASGKSTFLKSCALGAILAQSIGTVPCKSWFSPYFRIFTSMAVRDSIKNGESYFMAEIRSLKRIADAADKDGFPVLAIVDEVLRGTNTIERIAASSVLLKDLARPFSLMLAATHDIELTDLLAGCYRNLHFGGSLETGDVRFDYRLKEGPTTERNAVALIRSSGFKAGLADQAETAALHFEETGEWKL